MAQLPSLSPELQKIAIKDLGEIPTRVPDDLLALKTWIQQQPHLKARLEDRFLIQFLRGCKYSLERAKEKLDRFYALTSKYTDMFSTKDVDNPIFREVHNLGCFLPLPTPLNDNGPRIVIYRLNYPVEKYTIEQALQPCNTIHELMLINDPYACIQGLVYFIDFGEATFNHVLHFSPSAIKRMAAYLERSLPFRIKGFHFVNVTPFADPWLKAVKACLSDKLRQRIFIYGKDWSTKIEKHVPLKYLPKEYGGENNSLQQIVKDYNKVWDEYRDYFKENSQYGTDESLRTGKPMDFDSMFGMCGSFRKLEVD
ncbi:retinol-binding protein pinta-like [Haematobia irritans]|uniref:retinol-binding protein pinta-like n=1 Tax=Haematobia irritans TaxID=7368 RepID=UPI003F507797